ncbi:MAG: prolyl oligopeptidase family serine peptidase, partial [Cucumibacter sp.]
GLAAIREGVGAPAEIYHRRDPAAPWQQVSWLNGDVARDFPNYPEIRTVKWKGKDDLALLGVLLLPRQQRDGGPLPAIVDIHGGPCTTARPQFNPNGAIPAVAAGYAVFLPNYRGNVGWGQAFSKLNVGDPAGAEFDDILAGIDHCIAEGWIDANRLGVTGGSYGGYLTAWAVATTHRFKAAVMVAGISNQVSCHYSCEHHFHELINGGPLTDPKNLAMAIDRSPIFRLDKPTTPTLMLHGAEDRCTPVGQAQEFYAALLERGVHAELVIYPGEGHGLRKPAHRRDAAQRRLAWFDRYLRPELVAQG